MHVEGSKVAASVLIGTENWRQGTVFCKKWPRTLNEVRGQHIGLPALEYVFLRSDAIDFEAHNVPIR